MTAFMLTWKPELWPYEQLRSLIDIFESNGQVEAPWRLRAVRQAQAGDRAFLLKQGTKTARGIFGAGILLDAPSLRSDPSDAGRLRARANVRFDVLVDPQRQPFLIPIEELEGILEDSYLKAAASGQGKLPAAAEEWIVGRLGLVSGPVSEGAVSVSPGRPTTGPVPAGWTGTVTRVIGVPASTYAFRFEGRSIWKIGHTQDVGGRLSDVNRHIPHEEINERWLPSFQQSWPDETLAYTMEQAVLGLLAEHRTDGERVRCPEETLKSAWQEAFLKVRKR